MNAQERQALKALFVANAQYFDQIIPDDVLPLYVDDLADLPFPKVVQAMRELRRDPSIKRCPLPSQIRAKLTPESNPDSEALMVSGRITDAIARIGPYQVEKAREYIGPSGWEVVKLSGGWANLCALTTETIATHKAQWRMLAKAVIERGVSAPSGPAIEDKRTESGLVSLDYILKKLPLKEDA